MSARMQNLPRFCDVMSITFSSSVVSRTANISNTIRLFRWQPINRRGGVSENRNQHQYIHDFLAGAARNAKVARAMIEALRTLEVVNEAGVVLDGEEYVADYSNEILKLKATLRLIGVDEDEDAGGEVPIWRSNSATDSATGAGWLSA